MPGANAPPSSTVSWRPARRTASTRGPTSATSSSASPPIPLAAAPSYSRVTGRPPSPLPRRNPPTPPRFAPADTRRPARMRPHDAEWCSPDAYLSGAPAELHSVLAKVDGYDGHRTIVESLLGLAPAPSMAPAPPIAPSLPRSVDIAARLEVERAAIESVAARYES